MRIAQVAPLAESVPPRGYGGTERVVSWLTDELVARGHKVTLFASGDSQTSGRLRATRRTSLRADPACKDWLAHYIVMLDEVLERVREFDIVHFHIGYLHFPVSRWCDLSQITTLHGRLDLPDLWPLYERFADMPVVSISRAQRKPLARINWIGNVYHGIPRSLFALRPASGTYLAFLGRICPEKRPDRAIEIATRSGVPLKIAAKVDPVDQEYFEGRIKPLLNNPLVEFIGEIGDADKADFLGHALALVFPIDWPEPFGLVMIEAMACGTPIIAFRGGSVAEIVAEGVTGFIVDSVDEASDAVDRVSQIKRAGCRAMFETRFTSDRMASDYLRIYEERLGTKGMCHSRKEINSAKLLDPTSLST